MRAQHSVLSAEDLFGQVWDEHADPFTNTVRMTIMTLRRKLGQPAVLETVMGAGYRLHSGQASPPSPRLEQLARRLTQKAGCVAGVSVRWLHQSFHS